MDVPLFVLLLLRGTNAPLLPQVKNPEQRIDLEDVKRHPWMRQVAVRVAANHSLLRPSQPSRG